MLRNDEPSFSSMNEKSFESRRVRSQPCTCTASIGPSLCNACLTEMGVSMGGSLPDERHPTSEDASLPLEAGAKDQAALPNDRFSFSISPMQVTMSGRRKGLATKVWPAKNPTEPICPFGVRLVRH